jgi:NADPH2 dehydrogenase
MSGDAATPTGIDLPSNDFLREIWQPRPFISAGNYTRESAMRAADETGELVAFGRSFISNVS